MANRRQHAERLHAALTAQLAELRRAEQGALLHFATIQREQLFLELGYASIHAYGREGLGFSERKLSAFVRLAAALERLPATGQAIEAGALPWTKARELEAATPLRGQILARDGHCCRAPGCGSTRFSRCTT